MASIENASREVDTMPATADQPEALASLQNVTFAYGSGTVALENVTLDVRKGEFLSLIGPSGCGKSTILRLLSELSRPTQGEIRWADRAAGSGHSNSSGTFPVSVVFQDATLLPWRSSIDNAALPLELAGVGKQQRRAAAGEALNKVGLGSYLSALPRQLSGGMRMRVAIARALVVNPDLLLMDEPFGALDAITRERLQEQLLNIWQEANCTVAFVTHSVDEAVFLSSRVAVMTPQPGRIAQTFDVDMPYPRTNEVRNSDVFRSLRENVHRALFEHLDSY
jgi:NitT/TauT family transport system ATP-binding protein